MTADITGQWLRSDNRVTHIAMCGGACSGKTTLAGIVAQALRGVGHRATVVNEAATAAMTNGFDDLPTLDPATSSRMQAALAVAMCRNWQAADALTAAVGGGIVIHDRGPLDAYAYAENSDVDNALAAIGLSSATVLDMYDAVFGLESGPYEQDSNAVRYETQSQAALHTAQLMDMWAKHPMFIPVSWCGSANDRIPFIVSETCAIARR